MFFNREICVQIYIFLQSILIPFLMLILNPTFPKALCKIIHILRHYAVLTTVAKCLSFLIVLTGTPEYSLCCHRLERLVKNRIHDSEERFSIIKMMVNSPMNRV